MVANSTQVDARQPVRPRPTIRLRPVIGIQQGLLLLVLGALAAVSGCHSAPRLPDKNSRAYADVVSAFYVGLAALQVGDDVHAEIKLSEVTQLVPGEPAGWANWGVLALRQRNYDTAALRLERARDLAYAHRGEERIADRQHRRAKLVFPHAHVVAQVAQLGERVGEARNGRLGQAGAHRDFLVAEHRLERREAAQDFQPARERGRELAVAFVFVAIGAGSGGKRCGGI